MSDGLPLLVSFIKTRCFGLVRPPNSVVNNLIVRGQSRNSTRAVGCGEIATSVSVSSLASRAAPSRSSSPESCISTMLACGPSRMDECTERIATASLQTTESGHSPRSESTDEGLRVMEEEEEEGGNLRRRDPGRIGAVSGNRKCHRAGGRWLRLEVRARNATTAMNHGAFPRVAPSSRRPLCARWSDLRTAGTRDGGAYDLQGNGGARLPEGGYA